MYKLEYLTTIRHGIRPEYYPISELFSKSDTLSSYSPKFV